jgi:putative GTP pyrophosphokinase
VSPPSKTRVNQLGDRLRRGKIKEDDLRQLDAYRRSFSEAYEEVVAAVRSATGLDPTGRPAKSTASIIEKLRREASETMRLSQMQDIAGCRLVVQNVPAQNKVVEALMAALPRASVIDRRKWPSAGYYRAVHIIATARNKPIEIQVRTELQHLWAQLSEKLSDVLDPAIKYGGGDPDDQAGLSDMAQLIAKYEELELRPETLEAAQLAEVRRHLRQFLEGEIAKWPSNPKSEEDN